MPREVGGVVGDLKIVMFNFIKRFIVRVFKDRFDCGRNRRCPCGSGKKYKKCCLNKKI